MSLPEILLLAIALAMDATAVSATLGLAAGRIGVGQVLRVGGLFGGFQAAMPLIGWWIGAGVGSWVAAWDHWIAFGLLVAIGCKTAWEGIREGGDEVESRDVFGLRSLLLLAVATSIDALAAGFTLPILGAPLVLSIVTIGVATAALSALGLFAGRAFGARLGRGLDVFGGLVLVGLGVKILLEHLGAG